MLKLYPDVTLDFVGTVGGFERPLVERSGLPFALYREVQAGPIHGVNPFKALTSLTKLTMGTGQAVHLLMDRKPQAILSTGGWVSLPVALAARILRIPTLIYLPDIEPGLTIKVLRSMASKVAVTVAESQKFFRPGQTVVTGYPLRSEILNVDWDRAMRYFSLDAARPVLLVFGGSRGARAVNVALGHIIGELLTDGVQIIHVTGTLDWERTLKHIGPWADHPDYHGYSYLHEEMPLAFAAADVVVCRAGASILGEFPVFGLPSVLIPLAYSWRYQQVNADYLAAHGAALHLDESRAMDDLLPILRDLFNTPERLTAMREAARTLANPHGADNVARVLAELAQGTT
ncbi:MAG: UDP-N-acetylglucosamine--N-acetylmuramyl-(pentapeptide) pyrophosphoryl-undecaprenol N-acetylglucosamine transferase [Anaerolineae bacterium]